MSQQISAILEQALSDHMEWKIKLRMSVNSGAQDIDADHVCRDDCCAFGKALRSEAFSPAVQQSLPYQVVNRLHKEFHVSVGNVVRTVQSGDQLGARALMEQDFVPRTTKLEAALRKWDAELHGTNRSVA